jgi:hypothetical protein
MIRLKSNPGFPAEQEAIRGRCFHPTGTFVEFPKHEIEQSIPERFEKSSVCILIGLPSKREPGNSLTMR